MGALPPQIFHEMRESVHYLLTGARPKATPMKLYPEDYEYEEASAFDLSALAKKIQVEEYAPLVNAFADSIGRIRALHLLPINLIFHMQIVAIAHTSAVALSGHDPSDLNYDMTEEDHARSQVIFQKLLRHFEQAPGGVRLQMVKGGALSLKEILKLEAEKLGRAGAIMGIEAILAAIVTAGYSALESLAGDLWVAALNRHPDRATAYLSGAPDKQITFAQLSGRGLDLSHQMGTILTETRKVQFQTFNDIRNAFVAAFGDYVKDVFADCTAVLHAEKVRHLIAHRGGFVDAKFKNETKDRPEYASLGIGDQIPFSGPMVREHLRACINMGSAIIYAVDSWSATAPTS